MKSFTSTLNIEIRYLNKSGREKRVILLQIDQNIEDHLRTNYSPFTVRKKWIRKQMNILSSPKTVWITSCQIPV